MLHHHKSILTLIRSTSGVATQHTFMDHYLGTKSPRYAITTPLLRKIIRDWMKQNSLTATEVVSLVSSLVAGKSSTEKIAAGILLDYTSEDQRKFNPVIFDKWVDHLIGWAEVDAVCSGKYTARQPFVTPVIWSKLLLKMAMSKNINKRRASLVMRIQSLRLHEDQRLAEEALHNIGMLKTEREILITKAISWLLRSMTNNHKELVRMYVDKERQTLPAIAVRETITKLATGRKNKKK